MSLRGAFSSPILVLLLVGCSTTSNLQRTALRCETLFKGDSRAGFYSFVHGTLREITDPEQVDLFVFYDGDDCREGALIGHWDEPGYLFPMGKLSWSGFSECAPPKDDAESVAAIAPLTKDQEGTAFWVKTPSGDFYQVRLVTVEPTTYEAIVAGQTPTLEFEWRKP